MWISELLGKQNLLEVEVDFSLQEHSMFEQLQEQGPEAQIKVAKPSGLDSYPHKKNISP